MLQPQKQKRGHAFSYKPSILANDKRVVTAMDVDPSNEVSVVEGLFKQSMEVTGIRRQPPCPVRDNRLGRFHSFIG